MTAFPASPCHRSTDGTHLWEFVMAEKMTMACKWCGLLAVFVDPGPPGPAWLTPQERAALQPTADDLNWEQLPPAPDDPE
jgi:hypothetical protein